jgi:hypothetical protein
MDRDEVPVTTLREETASEMARRRAWGLEIIVGDAMPTLQAFEVWTSFPLFFGVQLGVYGVQSLAGGAACPTVVFSEGEWLKSKRSSSGSANWSRFVR